MRWLPSDRVAARGHAGRVRIAVALVVLPVLVQAIERPAAGLAFDPGVLDQLREDLGGPALREVIETFLGRTPSALSALRDAAARADANGMRQAAHMIKGTSAMLGARELSERAAEIERVGRAGSVQDAATRVAAVEASYRTLEAILQAESEKLRP